MRDQSDDVNGRVSSQLVDFARNQGSNGQATKKDTVDDPDPHGPILCRRMVGCVRISAKEQTHEATGPISSYFKHQPFYFHLIIPLDVDQKPNIVENIANQRHHHQELSPKPVRPGADKQGEQDRRDPFDKQSRQRH